MRSGLISFNENTINIEGFTKTILIIGYIFFILQNFLFFIFVYSIPLDVLGALFLSFSLIYIFIRRRLNISLIAGITLLGWSICTLIWRFLIYQNLEMSDTDYYGQNVVVLFGVSAILFFVSLYLLFRTITYSIQFQNFVEKKKKIYAYYVRIFILYLLLHLSFSIGITIGGLNSNFIIMLQLGLFVKLFIIPIFGILVFGVLIYMLTIDKIKVNT
ncbi:MAG: hypothetical protein ACFFDI_23560 [Promethearchaeota archaeon]